jgi:hypothetical protein
LFLKTNDANDEDRCRNVLRAAERRTLDGPTLLWRPSQEIANASCVNEPKDVPSPVERWECLLREKICR